MLNNRISQSNFNLSEQTKKIAVNFNPHNKTIQQSNPINSLPRSTNDHKQFQLHMFTITSSLSPFTFKDISKDTFTKFKKVRSLNTPLMSDHCLYSKDGVKYIVKQLPSDQQFFTTRPCGEVFFHKYTAPKSGTTHYVYPVIGVALQAVIGYGQNSSKQNSSGSKQSTTMSQSANQASQAGKEYANLLSRHCNSLEKVFLHLLKCMVQMVLTSRQGMHLVDFQKGSSSSFSKSNKLSQTKETSTKLSSQPINIPIILECLYVHNGQIFYCYDSWMNSETQIVVNDIRQIENLFLEGGQLKVIEEIYEKEMKRKAELIRSKEDETRWVKEHETATFGKQYESQVSQNLFRNPSQPQQPIYSLFSSLYKAFMLILYLGSAQLNLRQYEWGQFKISCENLEKRLHHFKLRYNNSKQKLGNLLEKVLLSQKEGFEEVKMGEVLGVLANLGVNERKSSLSESGCKSEWQSVRLSIKAPKRVTLAKKSKVQSIEHIALCESIFKQDQSFLIRSQSSQINTFKPQKTQTTEFNQNLCYQSHKIQNSKNRTLSNFVLKESNSMQLLQKPVILIQENENQRISYNKTKNNNKSSSKRRQTVTSTKKNKENSSKFDERDSLNSKNSNIQNRLTLTSKSRSVSKQLFTSKTSKLISQIIQALESVLQVSPQLIGSRSLTNFFGLEYFQCQYRQQKVFMEVLTSVNVSFQWSFKKYNDGSLYFGEMFSTQDHPQPNRHGYGIYIFPSKDIYIGNWHNHLMQGHGTYLFQSGELYCGQLLNGHKDGYGSFYYSDGKTYEGFWERDRKVGLGTVCFRRGVQGRDFMDSLKGGEHETVKFLGEFKDSCRNDGQVEGIFMGYDSQEQKLWTKPGFLSSFNQSTFQFLPSSGQFHQTQTLLLNCSASKYRELIDQLNGTKYSGQVEDKRKHGFGIEENEEECYEGDFVDNQRHGKGKLTIKEDGLVVDGIWENGVMVEYLMGE